MELSSRSEDFREGLAVFREKRPPEFRGPVTWPTTANEKVYIHELIDIIGHNRARYMHHMTANWCPIAREERNSSASACGARSARPGAGPRS